MGSAEARKEVGCREGERWKQRPGRWRMKAVIRTNYWGKSGERMVCVTRGRKQVEKAAGGQSRH